MFSFGQKLCLRVSRRKESVLSVSLTWPQTSCIHRMSPIRDSLFSRNTRTPRPLKRWRRSLCVNEAVSLSARKNSSPCHGRSHSPCRWYRTSQLDHACDRLSVAPRPAVSTVLRLSETSGFTLGLEEAEDVVLANCSDTYVMSAFVDLVLPSILGCHDRLFGGRAVRTGSLDVSDDRSGLVVHELDANLGNTTARACRPAETS
ncbi:hypothetical protein FJTKL_12627 [Diaporthe vaccinii]|uniref:Uncharacterized protein n=1 Tax=Diaporthe vaccinii TaxID=105482 RepID=A0ABR4ED74_9PEZI